MAEPAPDKDARSACVKRLGMGVLFGCGVLSLGMIVHQFLPDSLKLQIKRQLPEALVGPQPPPFAVVAGPPRTELEPRGEGAAMAATNQPKEERWADISGNLYAQAFRQTFSYEDGPAKVLVQVAERGETLRGRIEAYHLKPNFAYQIKVLGDWKADPEGARAIGYVGRWRLPGEETNYTDAAFEAFSPKADVEAYIFFDFFVTDAAGNAVREFALDQSLHVLWNRDRQQSKIEDTYCAAFAVDASSPEIYASPKEDVLTELLLTEREAIRYRNGDEIRLPPRTYQAILVLTEESFHATDLDGGYWATVFQLPMQFEIVSAVEP